MVSSDHLALEEEGSLNDSNDECIVATFFLFISCALEALTVIKTSYGLSTVLRL